MVAVGGVVYVDAVAPGMGCAFFCHWYVIGPTPVATTRMCHLTDPNGLTAWAE